MYESGISFASIDDRMGADSWWIVPTLNKGLPKASSGSADHTAKDLMLVKSVCEMYEALCREYFALSKRAQVAIKDEDESEDEGQGEDEEDEDDGAYTAA